MASPDNKFAVRFILIGLAAIILIVLIVQFNNQRKAVSPVTKVDVKKKEVHTPTNVNEMFQQQMPAIEQPIKANVAYPDPQEAKKDKKVASTVLPSEPLSNEDYKAVDFETSNNMPADCYPRDRLTTEDLLPKDAANSKWAQVNPAGQGDVKDQNFLNAGFHVGVNTVGQTLRNANYQIRSDPPNPRVQVSPWNQTTIEYDSSRRHFEVGGCD